MEKEVQDKSGTDPEVGEADPRTISQVRLQIQVSNAIAALDLSEVEAERLAGVLCQRVGPWVRNVYEAECLNHNTRPRRPRKYDKMVG